MAGLIASMAAGFAEGAGTGGAKAAQAWTEGLWEEEKQKAAAARAESLTRLKAKLDTEMETNVRQPFQTSERVAGENFRSGESAAERTSRENIHRDDRQSREALTREGHGVDRARIAEQSRHNQAMEKIQAASEGRLKAGADLDNAVKQLALNNANRVEALKKEFSTATPERQGVIKDEIQLLTGKDNDNFLPVPLKDEMGNITGYKIFDKKAGVWKESNESSKGAKWDSTSGDVVLDGKKIGTAKTQDEARALIAKARGGAGGAAPTAPKPLDPLEAGDQSDVGFDRLPEETPAPRRGGHPARGLLGRGNPEEQYRNRFGTGL